GAPQLAYPRDHGLRAAEPVVAHRREPVLQGGVVVPDEVAQHVYADGPQVGADLDARDQLEAEYARFRQGLSQPIGGVVIGERQLAHAPRMGPLHELAWREAAVGNRRVAVQVDAARGVHTSSTSMLQIVRPPAA